LYYAGYWVLGTGYSDQIALNPSFHHSIIPLFHYSSLATEAGHGSENRASEGGYSSNIYHKTGTKHCTIIIFGGL